VVDCASSASTRLIVVSGIVTNGGVASTVRDAHVREYRALSVLEDGCAAFSPAVHETAINASAPGRRASPALPR
jgi:ureidoacrylate peracid hydrolase